VYAEVEISAFIWIPSKNKLKIKLGITNNPCHIPEYQVYSIPD
jgi:hypothetical protein